MDQATKWLDLSGKVVVVTGGSMGLGAARQSKRDTLTTNIGSRL